MGARKGLIEKSGVKPARSRHCNGEQIQDMPLERIVLGRFGGAMILSQENCLYINHRYTCERQGGELDYCLNWSFSQNETISLF